jgi:hypothetical protein
MYENKLTRLLYLFRLFSWHSHAEVDPCVADLYDTLCS